MGMKEAQSVRDPQLLTHSTPGRSRCTRAHRASPSAQEEDRSVTWTPGYPAVCSWHQRSSSSWVPTDPGREGCAVSQAPLARRKGPVLGVCMGEGGGAGAQPCQGTSLTLRQHLLHPSILIWKKKKKKSPGGIQSGNEESEISASHMEGSGLRTEGQWRPQARRRGRFGVCKV